MFFLVNQKKNKLGRSAMIKSGNLLHYIFLFVDSCFAVTPIKLLDDMLCYFTTL
jgi:hypothetical protein